MSLESIGRILPDLVKKLGLEKGMDQHRAIIEWPGTVGSDIAAHTEPVAVRGRRLVVRVSNPVWMNELIFLKPKILKRLNDSLGKQVIQDILFVMSQGGKE